MKASTLNRILKAEQASSIALSACATCRDWQCWIVVLDEVTGIFDPHPPSCPDCGRKIACKWEYKFMWDSLSPDPDDPRWESDPVWAERWRNFDWRQSVSRR